MSRFEGTFKIENAPEYGNTDMPGPGIMWEDEECGKVLFICPCGCGSRSEIPVNPDFWGKNQSWSLEKDIEGRPTLSPSIWSQKERGGCGAHYFIRDGKVQWA